MGPTHGTNWAAMSPQGQEPIPCAFGTSGSMRIAAFELRSQACQELTFTPLRCADVDRAFCEDFRLD